MTESLHDLARTCLDAGIAAAQPERVVADAIDAVDGTLQVSGRTPGRGIDDSVPLRYDLNAYDEVLVVGGGNAAGTAAAALETQLGDRIDGGVVVTDVPADTDRITIVEGSHPVPDESAVTGTAQLRDLLAAADAETLVLAVVTGGASALLPAPVNGLTLADLRATTDALLASGATIDEINAVRKHLSATKGGQLAAAAAPASVVALLFSDVVGNDPSVIGSGPFTPDPSTFADARAAVARHDMELPAAAVARLEDPPADGETPGPNAPVFDTVTTRLLADGYTAARAAVAPAREAGFEPMILSTRVRGEAREAARTHVAVAEQIRATGDPLDPPAVVISGGETTVRIDGDVGDGGPNAEFALSAALELDTADVVIAAVDTDGIDGASPFAGASIDAETVVDDHAAYDSLAAHDAATYLDGREATIRTGATGTNVNDLRVVVIS